MLRPDSLNRGVMEISFETLRHLLKLPDDVKFLKVRQNWEQEECGKFEILLEAPNLQETIPGNTYPWVNCIIDTEFCKVDEITHIVRGSIESN